MGFEPPCVWIVSGEGILGWVLGCGFSGTLPLFCLLGAIGAIGTCVIFSPPTYTEPVQQEQLVDRGSCRLTSSVRQVQDLTGVCIRSEVTDTTLGAGKQGPRHDLKRKGFQKSPKLPRNVTTVDTYMEYSDCVHGSRPSDQELKNSEPLGEQLMEIKKWWESICRQARRWSQCKAQREQTEKRARSKE